MELGNVLSKKGQASAKISFWFCISRREKRKSRKTAARETRIFFDVVEGFWENSSCYFFLLFVKLNPAAEKGCELSIKTVCMCVCLNLNWRLLANSLQLEEIQHTFYFMVVMCNKLHIQSNDNWHTVLTADTSQCLSVCLPLCM